MFLTAQSHHRSPQVVCGNFCLRQFSVFFFFEKKKHHGSFCACKDSILHRLFTISIVSTIAYFSNTEPILIDVFSMFHRLSILNFFQKHVNVSDF